MVELGLAVAVKALNFKDTPGIRSVTVLSARLKARPSTLNTKSAGSWSNPSNAVLNVVAFDFVSQIVPWPGEDPAVFFI